MPPTPPSLRNSLRQISSMPARMSPIRTAPHLGYGAIVPTTHRISLLRSMRSFSKPVGWNASSAPA
jgi:hypothetical protein